MLKSVGSGLGDNQFAAHRRGVLALGQEPMAAISLRTTCSGLCRFLVAMIL